MVTGVAWNWPGNVAGDRREYKVLHGPQVVAWSSREW